MPVGLFTAVNHILCDCPLQYDSSLPKTEIVTPNNMAYLLLSAGMFQAAAPGTVVDNHIAVNSPTGIFYVSDFLMFSLLT